MRRPRSLWLRLALILFLLSLLFWAVSSAIQIHRATHTFDSDYERRLGMVCRSLAGLVPLVADEPARLHAVAARLERTYVEVIGLEPRVAAAGFHPMFQIFDHEGRLLYRSAQAPATRLAPGDRPYARVVHRQARWNVASAWSPDRRYLVLGAESVDERIAVFRGAAVASILPWGQNLLVTLTLTWLVARFALRPLRRLAREIGRRRPNDVSPLTTGTGYAETRPLVEAMNALFDRLAALRQREKRFLADAAHELRTPMAAMQAQLHVYRHARDDAERAAVVDDIAGGLDRAVSLSRQLIALAQIDADEERPPLRPVNAVDVAQDVIARCVPLALVRSVDIRYEGDECCRVAGDEHALRSALHNLIDNAVKYARPGGEVRVAVRADGHDAAIEVQDDGPGVPAEYRPRLFERFFRVPGSEAPGSGLGLAIVKTQIERQGGRVAIIDGLRHCGIGFRLSLPLCAADRPEPTAHPPRDAAGRPYRS